MKTKYLLMVAVSFATLQTTAQETYENANLLMPELSGTARYVGMGGAMEALGADMSTISSNPAGMGLFRSSAINASFGLVSQQDGKSFSNVDKINASFDQVGGVYSLRSGNRNYVNFAINYHKNRNFDFVLSTIGSLNNASQNKLTATKYNIGVFKDQDELSCSQVDLLWGKNLPVVKDAGGNVTSMDYYNATGYTLNRAYSGYIGNYEFSVSGNVNDRFYYGLTMGYYDVHYKGYGEYSETFAANANNVGGATMVDDRRITGDGFDVKFGAIFRPIETSPFRLGVYVHTPTYYSLTTQNYTALYSSTSSSTPDGGDVNNAYDYKIYTPWVFGFSLGHTVGNYLALGATYEYSDYSSTRSRIIEDEVYDYYTDSYYYPSSNDGNMNDHTKSTLKGVSTLKLGLEYRPIYSLSLRLGYNYVSPMYDKKGYKDGSIYSPGTYYASATDYTNWESTNRFTCGVGYTTGHFSFDLAYQYSATNGYFSPFMNYYDDNNSTYDNVCDAVKVSNKRNQLLFTMGYRF